MAIRRVLYLACIILLAACNESKHLSEGQNLYVANKIKTETTDVKKKKAKAVAEELEGLLRPRLNSKILGIRFRLWIYNIAGTPKKEKGFKHWLKYKVGEEPVLASPTMLEKNRDVLQNHLENKGFFKDTVILTTSVKNKKLTAIYTARFGPQYTIRNVSFPNDSDDISKRIDSIKKRSLLRKGDPYDLDVIKDERNRIDMRLKQRGFYFFNPGYLVVDVDTAVGNHQVDMSVKYKDEMPDDAYERWRVKNITVFAEYDLHADTNKRGIITPSKIRVVDTAHLFKPSLFDNTIIYRPGDIYRLNYHTQTLSRFVSLGVFKFVKARYEKADTAGNGLNVTYYLNPTQKKSIQFEVSALTRSDNTTGSEVSLTWRNRNLFKGAELFTSSIYAGLEEQFIGRGQKISTRRGGVDLNLYFPRIVSPFHWSTASAYVPKTKINAGYDLFTRSQQYTLTSARTSFGYIFKQSLPTEHTVTLLSINYVRPTNIDSGYQRHQLDSNIMLERAIERQFIIGSSYNFNYNTQARPNHKPNNFYFNGNVDLSGNLLGLITGANLDKGKEIHIFNVPFAQYVRLEGDIRHYLSWGKYSMLASRITGGIGIAYGNSATMPYVKQFFAGGTNDIRAFRSRALGPGSYYNGNPNQNAYLPDQPGDVKLEMNVEYRTKLFSVVRWALFADAGNIWTRTYDSARVGSAFSGHFLNDVGVGIGTGLRFDFTILVLRVDLATPVRYPWYPDGHKWVFNKVTDISNAVLNLAIGYPF
ncbi:MAG TPA: BamA/TamA family outer membrane protein [Puia sp.]|nr:BamA/TamA family outer membrane protein [Puia sp.]